MGIMIWHALVGAFAIIGLLCVGLPIVVVMLGGRALRRMEKTDRDASDVRRLREALERRHQMLKEGRPLAEVDAAWQRDYHGAGVRL